MVSDDLKRFYILHYHRGFRIRNISVDASLVDGYKTEIELFKDETTEVIESVEEDIAHTILKYNKITQSDGSVILSKIRDKRRYYDAISYFGENRESKIARALEDLRSGKSPLSKGFWHDFDKALVKLIFDKPSSKDPDILWLKENYFHLLAFYLKEVKAMKGKSRNLLFAKHDDIRPIVEMTDRILSTAFLPKEDEKNPVELFNVYRQHLPDSLEDHSERVSMQLEYLRDLGTILTKVGSQEERIRILYVLDVYRRMYEMTLPILDLLRIAILLSKGETDIERGVKATNIISILAANGYSGIAEPINPQIRHCESHLSTRIREGKRKVLLTDRKGFSRIIIREYSYEEIVDHQQRLHDVVFPALFYAFAEFDAFLKLTLLDSFEYKLLLISKIDA
ncbi:MAG: hypothetical protein ACTSRQ_16290 [Candidatus Thorarchaeota archaeon]